MFTKVITRLITVQLFLSGALCLCAQNVVVTYQGNVTSHGTNFTGMGLFKFALVTSTNHHQTATAIANLSGQSVDSYTVINGGNGYVSAPAVTVSGGNGSGATATATVSGGVVTAVNVTSAGSGYFTPPLVTIAPPPESIAYASLWSNDGFSVAGDEPTAAISVPVNNGLFSVGLGDTALANMIPLDSALFTQLGLQLRIWFDDGVNGSSALSPVQSLTTAPTAAFALTTSNLSGTLPASQLTGTLTNNTTGNAATATIANNLSAGLTNWVQGRAGAGVNGYAGSMVNLYRKLAMGLPLRIMQIGDSVSEEARLGLENTLLQWMPRNGTIYSSGGSYCYWIPNGLGTFVGFGVADGIWPSTHYNMADGSEFTWQSGVSNGVTANVVELYYWQATGFGTLTVQTQAYGGSWGTFQTIACDNGGDLAPAYTNFHLPTVIPNCQTRLQSSGTNMVMGFGLWNDNLRAGFCMGRFHAPGLALTDYPSNALHTFLAGMKPDLLIINCKDVPPVSTFTNGIVIIEEILAQVSSATDVIYVAPSGGVGNDVNFANMQTQWEWTKILAAQYNRPMFDAFTLFQPTNRMGSFSPSGIYSDETHLGTAGQMLLGGQMAEWIGFPTLLNALGYSASGGQSEASGKANLSGGNNFTGPQNFNGSVGFANGFVDFTNDTRYWNGARMQLVNTAGNGITLIERENNPQVILKVKDSGSAFKSLLTLSNTSGRVSLDLDAPYQMNVGSAGRWNYFLGSNTPPPSPVTPGNAFFWNSNGVVYLLTSGAGNTWTKTNKIAP